MTACVCVCDSVNETNRYSFEFRLVTCAPSAALIVFYSAMAIPLFGHHH